MSYFMSHSGRKIRIHEFSEKDVCLEDIAHHLTKTCRFGGALPLGVHYSVAQHSILLAAYARDEKYNVGVQRALLMHDASEAYLGDMVTGVKCELPDYKKLEKKVSNVIYSKYHMLMDSEDYSGIVAQLDRSIVLDEAGYFFPERYETFAQQLPHHFPLDVNPRQEINLKETYHLFLYWCDKLRIKD